MGARKNGEFFSEVMVGVFMMAVLGLLVYFTIVISGVDLINGKTKLPRFAEFSDVGGLKLRDNVVMRGIPIGTVDQLKIIDSKVVVTLLLQGDVSLHRGYTLSICSGSLLGGNYLLISDGEGELLPSDEVLHGTAPGNWMRDLGEIVSQLKASVRGDEIHSIITNIEEVSFSIKKITSRLEQGKGTLGKLLSDDMSLYHDLSNTVANISSLSVKINAGTNSLGRLINDDGDVYAGLHDTVANLRSISDRLEKGEGTVGKLLSGDDTVYRDLQETIARIKNVTVRLDNGEGSLGMLLKDNNKVYDDLAATVQNLKIATDRLQKGEGTLGKLSADDQLYTEVKGLVQDVRQTVDNYRDTTPITAFASLLMGGL